MIGPKLNYSVVWIFAIAMMVMSYSCRTEKPTIVIVTVKDTTGKTLSGASVRLYYQHDSLPDDQVRVDQTKSTGGDGKAHFDFSDLFELGQAGFAVLDVDVDGEKKVGVVKVEPEVENEAIVVKK